MKIKITNGNGWSDGMEGVVFEVIKSEYWDDAGEIRYFVGGDRAEYGGFVRESNCVVVSEESEDTPSDAVSSPSHYTQGGIEVIDIIAQTVAGYDDPFVGHCVGTSTKYLNRAPYKKKLLEDLKKSREYITFAINHIEAKEDA